MRFVHVIPTREQPLEKANRALPRIDLTLEQEVTLSAVLSQVRLRSMRRRNAYVVLVWQHGMYTRNFNRLWKYVRPSKRKALVE